MHVTVRLFARLRDIAGAPDLRLDVPSGATVGDVWTALAGRHSALAAYGASISCAVNDDYSRMSAEVHEGDEVAFLPPVSGGQTGSNDAVENLCSTS